jgi:hypothetical protein
VIIYIYFFKLKAIRKIKTILLKYGDIGRGDNKFIDLIFFNQSSCDSCNNNLDSF